MNWEETQEVLSDIGINQLPERWHLNINLKGTNLSKADLRGANLAGANLRRANLRKTNLYYANLQGADLHRANLRKADLGNADLGDADLYNADLHNADLHNTDLRNANLSGTKGLLNASTWLQDNLESSQDGYIVYKRFGDTEFPQPWSPEPKLVIEEVVNPCRTVICGCGINWGTLEWCQEHYTDAELWKCLLRWEDLADTIVPYLTEDKARSARLTILEKVK